MNAEDVPPEAGSNSSSLVVVLVVVLCMVIIGGSLAFIVLNWNEPDATRPVADKEQGPKQVAMAGPKLGDNAPEIDGEDADGQKFKLTDYRGKVIVLDFWAGW